MRHPSSALFIGRPVNKRGRYESTCIRLHAALHSGITLVHNDGEPDRRHHSDQSAIDSEQTV